MKNKALLTLIALSAYTLTWADTFTTGDLKYETLVDGTVSVARADGVALSGELTVPSSVSYGGKDYDVSQVAWGGFCDTKISKAVLPKSIKKISDEAFSDCAQLKEIVLPTYLASIGRRAFDECDALQTIECRVFFPSSVSVNGKAFSNEHHANTILYVPTGSLQAYQNDEQWQKFDNIQEKDMDDVDSKMFTFTVIGDNAVSVAAYDKERLAGDIVIPGEVEIDGNTYTVTAVAYEGFYRCSNITSVALPNSVETIGSDAFESCSKLESISLSESLTEIGWWAFAYTPISQITLPESLKTIGSWAFYGCSKLEDITIPKNVSSFGWGVFSGDCNALKDIKVSPSNTSFVSKEGMLLSADSSIMYAYAFAYPTEHLTIPETVVSLNRCALFKGNVKLQTITVPSGVTYIGGDTFSGCTNLTTVSLPDGITEIEYSAFYGCSSLASVTIPQSLSKISSSAFGRCSSINSVIVRQNKPLEISANLFNETVYQNATLYVPTGRAKYYKDAIGWAKFANIQEMEMEGVEVSTNPYDNIEDNQMILGYYTSNDIITGDNGYGGRNAGRYKVCVRYTKEQMEPFAGNSITNIRFALANTDILGPKIWIGSSRDKKDLLEQSVTELKKGWNEVTLQTPFTITGDTIFIGLEYKQSGTCWPISAVSEGSEEGCFYIYGPYNGSDEDEVWIDDDDEALSLQCIVEGDHIPQYDLHTVRMSIGEKYLKAGEQYYGYLYLRNWGKKPVSSMKLACEINGRELTEKSITNIGTGINSYSMYFKPDTEQPAGCHEVTFRVKEINGEQPLFAADDAQSKRVKFYTEDMGRDKVLLESFTGTWCGYCPRAHKSIEALMEGRDDIVLLSNHGSDALSCEASEAYCVFTDYFPASFYDRYAGYGATSLGYIGIDKAKQQPSFAKLAIQAEYDENSRNAYITIVGEKNAEFDLVEQYANLTVLLTEDGIVAPQVDFIEEVTHYDYIHNGVLRQNLSDIWGDPVSWDGNKFEMRYAIKLNDGWVKDNMNVVAFLAKPFTGSNYEEIGLVNCNDFMLRNAGQTNGVINVQEAPTGIVRAEGRRFVVDGDYVSMKVYTADGKTVVNSNLPCGMYIIKVQTKNGMITKKATLK